MHRCSIHRLICLLPCTGLGFLSPAVADTLSVCSSGCDYSDIQSAINDASDGDVIEIAAGTYRPGSTIDTLGKAITLQGSVDSLGEPATTVDGDVDLDGSGDHRCLACTSGEKDTTIIRNLRVINGVADEGGGLYTPAPSKPRIENCVFAGNTALSGNGGGISGQAVVDGCLFEDNAAYVSSGTGGRGGGVAYCRDITNSVFQNNTAEKEGGGLFVDFFTSAIEGCTFESNTCTDGPGGGASINDSTFVLKDCTFRDNTARRSGGGFWTWAVKGTLIGCVFEGNESIDEYGGGLASNAINLLVEDCEFIDNVAKTHGGGLYYEERSELETWLDWNTFLNCTFEGNIAGSDGGGMWASGRPDLQDCLFKGNKAGDGGGLLAHRGVTPRRCVFMDNEATHGGGLAITGGSMRGLEWSMLCANTPDQVSGVLVDNGTNCISASCDLTDSDGDGFYDCVDQCPGFTDIDSDEDGTADCIDQCPGESDSRDTDEDGTPDCTDECPFNPDMIEENGCGCDSFDDPDLDTDGDGVPDCIDSCPEYPLPYDCSSSSDIVVPVGASIQVAVDLIPDGGYVFLEPGEHVLHETIDPKGKTIILDGPHPADPFVPEVTISGDRDGDGVGDLRLIQFVDGEGPLTLVRFIRFTKGRDAIGGAVLVDRAHPHFEYCVFDDNEALESGGAVFVRGNSQPGFRQCRFEDNRATEDGGAVMVAGSEELLFEWITFSDCRFIANTARLGGALMNRRPAGGYNSVSFEGCTIDENTAEHGGGVFTGQLAGTQLLGSRVRNNHATLGGGGGLESVFAGWHTVKNTEFCGNQPQHIDGIWLDEGGNNFLLGCPEEISADIDGNGRVDGADMGLLIARWGPCLDEPCAEDINGDGEVNGGDLGILIASWSQ